ncbi:MAG: hypothetical protein DWQ42_18700 [Planctomycetota bacterium]|nr:MAG: hypothetical protein DWQ42_18700 [Planctomycetota bacterium]REK43118.1 MAG: hypothetical protein DWQ46_12145 [Planctomycetota bacterium]
MSDSERPRWQFGLSTLLVAVTALSVFFAATSAAGLFGAVAASLFMGLVFLAFGFFARSRLYRVAGVVAISCALGWAAFTIRHVSSTSSLDVGQFAAVRTRSSWYLGGKEVYVHHVLGVVPGENLAADRSAAFEADDSWLSVKRQVRILGWPVSRPADHFRLGENSFSHEDRQRCRAYVIRSLLTSEDPELRFQAVNTVSLDLYLGQSDDVWRLRDDPDERVRGSVRERFGAGE